MCTTVQHVEVLTLLRLGCCCPLTRSPREEELARTGTRSAMCESELLKKSPLCFYHSTNLQVLHDAREKRGKLTFLENKHRPYSRIKCLWKWFYLRRNKKGLTYCQIKRLRPYISFFLFIYMNKSGSDTWQFKYSIMCRGFSFWSNLLRHRFLKEDIKGTNHKRRPKKIN